MPYVISPSYQSLGKGLKRRIAKEQSVSLKVRAKILSKKRLNVSQNDLNLRIIVQP